MTVDKKIFSLHKYFFWADRMRVHFIDSLKPAMMNDGSGDKNGEDIADVIEKIDLKYLELYWVTDIAIYMSYWYGGLYTVIEGWKELGLSDPNIDELLESPFVDLLRRYRNGTFHYQKEDFDVRFSNFLDKGVDSAGWALILRNEFHRYFRDWYKVSFEEMGLELDVDNYQDYIVDGKINIELLEKHLKT